jgi:hypothetical protein
MFAAVAAVAACSAPGSNGPAQDPNSSSGGTSSSSGGTGSSSGGTGPLGLPFQVSDSYVPSGFMGDSPTDFNAVKMSPDPTKCTDRDPAAKGACYTVNWTPVFLSGQKSAWVGVYWQYPANNWGAKEGKDIPAGATKVSFSAKGAAGGEKLTVIAGGVNIKGSSDPTLTHADTFQAQTDVQLTTSWAHYEIPLTGDTYSKVIGAFAWSMTTSASTPVQFFVDDISWE